MAVTEATVKWGLHTPCVAYNREPSPDMRDLYLTAVEELTDEQFRHAVNSIVRTERFFPAPAVVLDYGWRAPQPERLALSSDTRTPEQRRAAAAAGMATLRAELKKRGIDFDALPVKEMPK